MNILNLNVGLLGHVDSGKTSLAKALSQVSSTAAFDKDPQSQERGITLDLGFSSFISDFPSHIPNTQYEKVQFTLVDCPGHASLIKTIIGGAHIIDIMVLVIDASKGIQTQTSECIIIGEITKKKMIVVINKIDLLEERLLEKLLKKMRLTIDSTFFKGSPIVTASALNCNVKGLVDVLLQEVYLPKRDADKPFLFAVDHCFGIKGKGTVMTGTILQGCVKVNDDIEIPSINLAKKVKSMQMFKKPVDSAIQGDRVGICVTQFDPKLLERGIASKANYVKKIYAAVMDFTKVQYYKNKIESKSCFHINVGYENTIASLLLFGDPSGSKEKNGDFDFEKEYKYIQEIDESTPVNDMKIYVLLEFSKPILVPEQSLVIGARLDALAFANSCRLAFYGYIVHGIDVKNYHAERLKNLKIYKEKYKQGVIDRVANEYEVIGKNMFKKETNIQKFVGMKVTLSSGEEGVIESSFGQSGKFKVRIPDSRLLDSSDLRRLLCVWQTSANVTPLKMPTAVKLAKRLDKTTVLTRCKSEEITGLKSTNESGQSKKDDKSKTTEIHLHHKRYIFDINKKIIQS